MKESKFGILFRHWVFANATHLLTSSFELKQTPTNSLPFSAVEDHQINMSETIKYGPKGALIRVESGTIGTPDYLYLKNTPAFIVIYYNKDRIFVIIDIDTFILEKKKSKRKSLTWERAQIIAWKTVKIKKGEI